MLGENSVKKLCPCFCALFTKNRRTFRRLRAYRNVPHRFTARREVIDVVLPHAALDGVFQIVRGGSLPQRCAGGHGGGAAVRLAGLPAVAAGARLAEAGAALPKGLSYVTL